MDFNNPVSVAYSKMSIESFKPVEDLIEIIPIQCITPKDFKWVDKVDQYGIGPALDASIAGKELYFWPTLIYMKNKHREWTEGEKACFSSHFKLWYQNDDRWIIMEHDAYLLDEDKFRKDFARMNNYDIWMPGIAVEFYSMSRKFLNHLYNKIDEGWHTIPYGPMAFLEKLWKDSQFSNLVPKNGDNRLLSDGSNSCITQAYSDSLGLTLEHTHKPSRESQTNFFYF